MKYPPSLRSEQGSLRASAKKVPTDSWHPCSNWLRHWEHYRWGLHHILVLFFCGIIHGEMELWNFFGAGIVETLLIWPRSTPTIVELGGMRLLATCIHPPCAHRSINFEEMLRKLYLRLGCMIIGCSRAIACCFGKVVISI
jgi:hypothetical protein